MEIECAESPRGLTLAFFKHFVDVQGGRGVFQDLTTEQVCDRFVIPYTESTEVSLVDHVGDSGPDGEMYVRRATWFVSHAWSYLFLDIIDALDHFMDEHNLTSEKESAGLWFCLFNNNQHKVRERSFLHWYTTFKAALTAIGNVVMVFSPWNNPIALTRSWCVFERDREKLIFLEHIKEYDVFELLLSEINSANSTTTFPTDRDAIFDLIEKGPGFDKLDRMVFVVLEAWIFRTLETQMALASTPEEQAQWLFVKGDIVFSKREFTGAEAIFQSTVAILGNVARERSPLYWRAISHLAMAKQKQNHPRDAWEQLFLDALAHQEKLLGPKHDHTLETMCWLGDTYCYVDEYNLGMPFLYKCFEMSYRIGGLKHSLTLPTASAIGRNLMFQNRIVEAKRWLADAHRSIETEDDVRHIWRNNIGSDLANCYAKQGQFALASQFFENIYRMQVRTLGPEAHATLVSLRALSVNLCSQGKYENLETNLLKCYDGFLALKSYGWAADCQKALGILYHCLEDHARAKFALDATYATFIDMFGHTSTPARKILFLRFFVAMESPEDVDSMDKINFLESLVVDANLQHETWTEFPCHCCFNPIQGTLYMCPICPRYSLQFCDVCVSKSDATCGHAPTEWICRLPPARFLLHARLYLLSTRAMWTDYSVYFQAYQDHCDLYGVSDRIEDIRPSGAISGKMATGCVVSLSFCVVVVLAFLKHK
ncbi:Aste57867_24286 [Aphanomyces stellatus]|uniref:Aste57867_24286 protein n=1 Tax=Aphanomyces stellatus TaxID=120398 RepID=A0A485LPZ6_9STRA|nr:hypothetical protein As57867_024211 [Aphanomyces stellatus]VFU00926.1 Aste57867_24286 [Aphanomyces stellatus]